MWKCFYFTTISFSTVGYGDFLIKADPASRGLSTMGFVVTLYLGISFFSLFLATLQVPCAIQMQPHHFRIWTSLHCIPRPAPWCHNRRQPHPSTMGILWHPSLPALRWA